MTATLRPIADDLWEARRDVVMYGLVHFPVRMTVARLRGGDLWLCSPVPIDDALATELAALGPVAHIVAPNRLHHLHFAAAAARYPDATRWAAPGLSDKRTDLEFHGVLDDDAEPPWHDELEHVFLAGSAWMNEVVFFHHATRTLVVTDLLFNLQQARNGFTRLVLRMVGAYGRPGQSRMVRFTTRDRPAFKQCLERVLDWDMQRIVVAHGEILQEDPKAILRNEASWALGPAARHDRSLMSADAPVTTPRDGAAKRSRATPSS